MENDAVPAELTAALLAAGYRIGGPAGVGGGGPVWTATRVSSRPGGPHAARVVVQVVPAPAEADGGPLGARLRELRSLDHPHLARVVDVLDVPAATSGRRGAWAVLLGEVPGTTVAALLAARGRLTAGEVVTLVVPVAGALDALHRAGLVHGDVSPANVVVRPDGRPVLIDLLGDAGLAAGTGGRRRSGARGTPGFVAPELGRERPVTASAGPAADGLPAGAPADVFALACVGLAALDLAAAGGRLGQELAAARAVDPVLRPTAAEVAAACYPCASPEPIALPDAGVLARTALAQLATETRTVSAGGRSRHRARRVPRLAAGRGARRRAGEYRGARDAQRAYGAQGAGGAAGVADDRRRPVRAGGGRRRGAALLVAGAGAVLAGVLAVGSLLPDGAAAGGSPPGARSGASGDTTATPPAADPVAAAVELTRRRAEVLTAGDPDALADVSRPGSGAHSAGVALLADLRAAGLRLEGLAAVVEGAGMATGVTGAGGAGGAVDAEGDGGDGSAGDPAASMPRGAPLVEVTVRSGLTAHRRVAADGVVEVPAQPVRDVVLRLVLTADGWRVEDVVADP